MMNGVDLINNLIDELGRARDLLYSQNPEESSEEAVLVNDIRTDLDRYYDMADEIDDAVKYIDVC
jgi:hypothetical protein|nr:MAG TPA: hypothetical protein [Bacteriophage sp.]